MLLIKSDWLDTLVFVVFFCFKTFTYIQHTHAKAAHRYSFPNAAREVQKYLSKEYKESSNTYPLNTTKAN